jgi:hypothetical protein
MRTTIYGRGTSGVEITEICEKTAKYEKGQKIRRLRKNTGAGDQASFVADLLKYASYLLRLVTVPSTSILTHG